MIEKSIGDIIDRWSIVQLKVERIGTEEYQREFSQLSREIVEIQDRYKNFDITQWCELMYSINDKIWNLESGLRSGKQNLPNAYFIMDDKNWETLGNIGIVALLVRDYNNIRVSFKNVINKLTGCFLDTKKGHLSE